MGLGNFLTRKGQQFKDWKAKAPERDKARLEGLQRQVAIEKQKTALVRTRQERQREQLKTKKMYDREMGEVQAPSLFGSQSKKKPEMPKWW